MASELNTKLRYVRCPKCRLVLPEPADVPIYRCGGCGAVLQAKNKKTDANDGDTSNIVQTGIAPKPTLEHASEGIVATNLNQQSTIVPPEYAGKVKYDCTDFMKECINHSEEPRSSTDISSHENLESSPEARALIDSDTETCHPDQDDRRDQKECSDSDKEQHGDINMSDGIYSSPSPELNYHHDSESPAAQMEVDESSCSLDEENVADRDGLEDSSRELPAELASHEVDESSEETAINTEVKKNLIKGSAFRSLIAEKLLDSRNYVEQIADPHLIPRRRNYVASSKELPKGDVRGKLGRNQNVMNRGKWPHEYPGPTKHGHPIRDLNALNRDDARSRVPYHERGSRANHHEDASTSTLGFSEFQYNSMYHSPVKPDDPESEKLELLRMVYQLQDQLNRSDLLTENSSGGYPPRVPMKENMSSYYHLAAEREMHHDMNYSRYPVRYGQGKSWSQQCKPSQTAFSGDALHNRGQINCSCFHCYSQERHYYAQLPPRDIYSNKGHYGTHYSPNQPGTLSPQHHTGSEYSLWSHETRFNDQWHREDRDMKNHQLPKRHFRPVAGGSPIVACYLCTETLQLPADFLLFRRRYHSLKCNACSKVLKFSLQNRSHLVPYIHENETVAPPPSEVAASVSYSDDYERAYSKGYSTEMDPSSIPAPFDRKMPSVSSSESTIARKKSVLQNHSVQSLGPGKFSSKKIFSEIEEAPATSGSPLHRLMGYASPSKVIRGG